MAETSDSDDVKRREAWNFVVDIAEAELERWALTHNHKISEQNEKNAMMIIDRKKKISMINKEQSQAFKRNKQEDHQELLQKPAMPALMRRVIEGMAAIGENPIWVSNKRLTESDVNPKLIRFFLPRTSKLEWLLSAEEKQRMRVEGKNKGNLKSKMVDGEGELWDLNFKHWASVEKYGFTTQWIQFVQKVGVKEGWIAQIWCFRNREYKLCFGINVKRN